jgi:hypothetical protein
MFDDSGISLSASDPNPSIDQYDDGGSTTDWSGIVSSAGQWGTELASILSNRPIAYAPGVSGGAPMPIGAYGSYVGNQPPTSSTTKLLMVVLGVGAAVVLIHVLGSR